MLSTKDVIQYLNQHGNVQAIEDMAAFFSVTPRTIRNHLRSVQDAYPACLRVGRGQVKRLKQIPEESSPSAQVPSSQQERSRYILRALLSRSEPMDLDELAEALEKGLITQAQMSACLRQLNNLITIIYRDKFDRLQNPLDRSGL